MLKNVSFLCLPVILFFIGRSVFGHQSLTRGDSCEMIIYDHLTKEMSLPEEEPYMKQLSKTILGKKDHKQFFKHALKPQSYLESASLLTHHNIVFQAYRSGLTYWSIEVSSFTRNAYFMHFKDGPKQVCHISPKFELFIINLLVKYDCFQLIDPIFRFPNEEQE